MKMLEYISAPESFPTSCKQGFPQFHERSQLYDISTMPAPTESISLSITYPKTPFYISKYTLSEKLSFLRKKGIYVCLKKYQLLMMNMISQIFKRAKRLCHIIVCPQSQACNLIRFFILRCQHYDRISMFFTENISC